MKNKLLFGSTLLVFFFTLFASSAQAIPAFARRYKLSCTTCHTPFPRLKPYGDEFAGNGFILKESEKARDYVSAGDELLWLNRDFPIAARFDAFAVANKDQTLSKDLQAPWGLKLLSGGTLYKGIGYYFYFYMSERGEIAGIEDAYIHFDNVFGTNLDIMVGQFQTSDPLMKRELRLTYEDYMLYKQKFGLSATNLTYDRGIMLSYGIDKTGTDLVAMVVNGNGKPEAVNRKFDTDNYKNIGLRINQGFGEKFSLGFYYYRGAEKITGFPLSDKNEITYYGPDVHVNFGYLGLTGQYLVRKDTYLPVDVGWRPVILNHEAKGYVMEIVVAPRKDRSRLYLVGLYNRIDDASWLPDYETLSVNANYLLARNLKMIVECRRDLLNWTNRFVLGLVSGF